MTIERELDRFCTLQTQNLNFLFYSSVLKTLIIGWKDLESKAMNTFYCKGTSRYVKACGLKDEELLLSNNKSLDDIFTSDQWENFFQTLLHDPENASYMCKKKCGVDVDMDKVKEEERKEVKEQANGADY